MSAKAWEPLPSRGWNFCESSNMTVVSGFFGYESIRDPRGSVAFVYTGVYDTRNNVNVQLGSNPKYSVEHVRSSPRQSEQNRHL